MKHVSQHFYFNNFSSLSGFCFLNVSVQCPFCLILHEYPWVTDIWYDNTSNTSNLNIYLTASIEIILTAFLDIY